MFEQLIEFVKQQPLFSGFIGASLIGTSSYLLRSVPSTLWNLILLLITVKVEVESNDPAYFWIAKWLSTTKYAKKSCNRLILKNNLATLSESPSYSGDEETKKLYALYPTFGFHVFFEGGNLYTLEHHKDSNSNNHKVTYTLSLRLVGFQRNNLINFINKTKNITLNEGKDSISMFTNHGWSSSWEPLPYQRKRDENTLILREGLLKYLINDIQVFLNNQNWYIERGLPYRRGYIFYGPPGTGKSSCVKVLASILNLPVYIIGLRGIGGDAAFQKMLSVVPPNSIILIEDIDTYQLTKREDLKEKQDDDILTFSGLLNGIDGVAASEGRILIITTNHKEALDPALIRPGRTDVHIEFELADYIQVYNMYLQFFPDHDEEEAIWFANDNKGQSPAEIQHMLIGLYNKSNFNPISSQVNTLESDDIVEVKS